MSIVTKLKDTLVKVEGSVDSSNAAQFEEELLSAISGQSLTIDAQELAYISSAGLRVILKAQKAMATKGGMKLLHVNETIMEVFDITGFADILTIE